MADTFEIFEIKRDDRISLGKYKASPGGKPVSEVLDSIILKHGLVGVLVEDDSIYLTKSDLLTAGHTYTFQPSTNVLPPVEEPSAKRQKSTFDSQIGEKIPMDFASEECDIFKVGVIGTLLSTVGMNKVMENFGGFPANYYVRQEEVYVLKTILEEQPSSNEWKFAILGSPGVGKSALLVFLAFYMVRHRSQSVLLLRKVKELTGGALTSSAVFLSGDYYRKVEFRGELAFVDAHRSLLKETPGLLYFVDGFSQDDIKKSEFLSPYRMLATSSQFTRKSDDPTEVVVLPPWQVGDLQDFAKKTKMFEPADTADGRSKELYYYSGGSLRDFCRSLEKLKIRVDESIGRVRSTGQTMMLMSEYGGSSPDQVDSLRRRYLNDATDKTQYSSTIFSKFVVDSGYVLRRLLQQCGKEQYKNVYNFAKAIGGAFHGWAFESYLHKSAISGGFTIQARKYKSRGRRLQYEIECSESISEGTTESECKTSLRKWAKNVKSKYWYPQYSGFPNIASVGKVLCKDTGKTILAYIQVTVGETHKLNGAWLDDLDEIFKADYGDRMYVAIQPKNVGSDQKLSLTPSDTKTKVPLYEAYFEESN